MSELSFLIFQSPINNLDLYLQIPSMIYFYACILKAIACAVEFDDQHTGIYAGDKESFQLFQEVLDPIIVEYHGLPANFSHLSDMDVTKLKGGFNEQAPIRSTR